MMYFIDKPFFLQNTISVSTEKDMRALEDRKQKQMTGQKLLEVQILQTKSQILKNEGPQIRENIQDKVSLQFALHEFSNDLGSLILLEAEMEFDDSAIYVKRHITNDFYCYLRSN